MYPIFKVQIQEPQEPGARYPVWKINQEPEPRLMNLSPNTPDIPADNEAHRELRNDLDEVIRRALQDIKDIRDQMAALKASHPINTNALANLVEKARSKAYETMFYIHRYYHVREEGLRIQREREYAALGRENRNKFVHHIRRAFITIRFAIEGRAAELSASRDARTQKLQDALDNVNRDRMLILLDDGGQGPY
ncbi:hypothetical protein FDECE_13320 [Fusarium decemcellulare]|nr:hypothetical protein FDECE_13320 [Fusarium decemcellulare]